MAILNLQHYNILTRDMEATIRFYRDRLGLRVAPPPGMSDTKENAWIYDTNDIPVVHVQAVDAANPEARFATVRSRLGDLFAIRDANDLRGGGAIEHVAFACSDYEAMRNELKDAGLALRENEIEAVKLRQIFVNDPNGITIELNFLG